MDTGNPVHTVKLFKVAFIGVELFFILVTLAALADRIFVLNLGLSWSTFFIGFIASAWGAVAYPVCGSCYGWTDEQS